MGNALDQWNDRHVINKESVDLSSWSLSKGRGNETTASKMRRERLLAIRSAVLKQDSDLAMDENETDNTDEEDQPKPKKKVKGETAT